jgi:3-deoxy-manno-octulosonate cytidylyltransferase (CMP-KDO synthetase)
MTVAALIPARFAATRLPGKPLLNQTGKFLIQHVYERAAAASRVDVCIVATDDQRIADAVRAFGGRVEMTRADHVSGTDRIAEVARRLIAAGDCGSSDAGGARRDSRTSDEGAREDSPTSEAERPVRGPAATFPSPVPESLLTPLTATDIILNVQGDEPEIEPEYLDRLVRRLEAAGPGCGMATLACPFPADSRPDDPSRVKVVLDRENRALYFSRSVIPYVRDDAGETARPGPWLLHLGVYAYRLAFLLDFASRPPSALERVEKLEQLRALDNGCAIAVEVVERACPGIDTPEDYAAFVARHRRPT